MKSIPIKSKSTPVSSSTPGFVSRGQRYNKLPINAGIPNLYKSTNQMNNMKKDYEFDFVGGCKFYRMCGCNYWPWFKNTTYKGAKTLSMLNILASWWHFCLANIVVIVSVMNSDPIVSGTGLQSHIIRSLGITSLFFCITLATSLAFYSYFVIQANDVVPIYQITTSTPVEKRTIECCTCFLTQRNRENIKKDQRTTKCIFIQFPLTMAELSPCMSISLWSLVALTFLSGCLGTFENIEGSYPVVFSSSITALDKIPPPFDSPYCNGEKYTDALKWIKCIGDNQQNINRTLYDPISGLPIPWRDVMGKTCEELLDAKITSGAGSCAGANDNGARRWPTVEMKSKGHTLLDGFTSDEACVGCAADGPGGEECTSRGAYSCVFNSSLTKYEALSGSDNDPTRIIPRPTFKVYTGTDEHPLFAWVFIFSFALLTSIMHCFLGTMAYYHKKEGAPCGMEATYIYMIARGRSPLRWLEYSITSAIMFTLVLTINRVTDVFIISFAFIISVLYNTFGAAIDYIDNVVIVTWLWTVSFIGFIAQFICLYIHFDLAIAPYIDPSITESADLWGQFFNIIRIINWGLLISFSTFPIVSLFHQCYKYKCGICSFVKYKQDDDDVKRIRNCMTRAEISYVWLSFVSKTLLIVTMLLGTTLRRNNSSED